MRRSAAFTPPPSVSDQAMLVVAVPITSPPFGAVRATCGRARPNSHTSVRSRMPSRIVLAELNGGSSEVNS